MKKILILLIILFFPIKILAQCGANQFEILCSTFSGEWAEEISWSIINNDGAVMLTFNGSDTENNNFYNNTVCLESCLLYTSPSPRDLSTSRMPSSA